MNLLSTLFGFLFRIGYFGPLLMGVLDSSFLILPFGNDLMVVALVARHHTGDPWHGTPWYVLSAAVGSTIGVLLLALVARKLGEAGLRKIAGDRRYDKLSVRIGNRAGLAVAVGALAPPPFPFTTVIAAVAALNYPLWRMLVINFFARLVRFTILAWLALKLGGNVMSIAKSVPFEWAMSVFIVACLVASGFSVWKWLQEPHRRRKLKAVPVRTA
jgi:membrane protein YqaA with SNARE-associated domain